MDRSVRLAFVVEEHTNGYAANDEIANQTEGVRKLTEQDQSEQRCKDDLRIIKYGDFPCRCVGIRCCNRKLSACGAQPCKQKKTELLQRHRVVEQQQIGQAYQTGEGGKEEHNERSALAVQAELSHHGVWTKRKIKPEIVETKV